MSINETTLKIAAELEKEIISSKDDCVLEFTRESIDKAMQLSGSISIGDFERAVATCRQVYAASVLAAIEHIKKNDIPMDQRNEYYVCGQYANFIDFVICSDGSVHPHSDTNAFLYEGDENQDDLNIIHEFSRNSFKVTF